MLYAAAPVPPAQSSTTASATLTIVKLCRTRDVAPGSVLTLMPNDTVSSQQLQRWHLEQRLMKEQLPGSGTLAGVLFETLLDELLKDNDCVRPCATPTRPQGAGPSLTLCKASSSSWMALLMASCGTYDDSPLPWISSTAICKHKAARQMSPSD